MHACCAPCFTAVNEKISDDFNEIIFWFNPNIEPKAEHDLRLNTLKQYLKNINTNLPLLSNYDYDKENKLWHQFISGMEAEPEGGKRCARCFEFRLSRLIAKAFELDIPCTTTLTVSPHKNAQVINSIGQNLTKEQTAHPPGLLDIKFLEFDFKKENGYRRSIEISKQSGLYRQNYCGCRYSQQIQNK